MNGVRVYVAVAVATLAFIAAIAAVTVIVFAFFAAYTVCGAGWFSHIWHGTACVGAGM